jgi:competence CoiA-like predicted nuclease
MESVTAKDGDESMPHFLDKSKLAAQALEIESESWLR